MSKKAEQRGGEKMEELTKLITRINIEMTGETKKYLVSAKQGDKATRFIIAKLINNGETYEIPTGARAVINIAKPDGKHVYNTCSYSGSDVTVELTNQALAAAGTAYCDIEIRTSDNSQIITSASFTIEIEKSQRDDNAVESSNEFSALEKLTKEAEKAINDCNIATKNANSAGKATNEVKENAESAANRANTAAKACESIADGMNTMIDTVTKKVCKMSIENGIIVMREV